MLKDKLKLKPHFGIMSIILTVISAVLLAADLLTKYLEETYNWNLKIIPFVVEIEGGGVHRNGGCAFSFLNDNPQIGQPILITLTFILSAFLIFGFIFLPNRFKLLKTSIAIVFAGAIGNLVDRLAFFYVRDWFGLWMFGGMTYCNFADFYIVIGVVLAVVDLMFLNEWAVFPLTKTAKAAQEARRAQEEAEKAAQSVEGGALRDDSGAMSTTSAAEENNVEAQERRQEQQKNKTDEE